jgi:hypothetical protein
MAATVAPQPRRRGRRVGRVGPVCAGPGATAAAVGDASAAAAGFYRQKREYGPTCKCEQLPVWVERRQQRWRARGAAAILALPEAVEAERDVGLVQGHAHGVFPAPLIHLDAVRVLLAWEWEFKNKRAHPRSR